MTGTFAKAIYHMCVNITCGLYYFNPHFESQQQFFKELFSSNSGLVYGQYSRALSNWVIMERLQY